MTQDGGPAKQAGEVGEGPYVIVELRAENCKRLKAATVRPDGELVVIGGRNAQGKSSLIDSIVYAIAGPRAMPDKVVRDGAREMEITLDLGGLRVQRTRTSKGNDGVIVTDPDGAKLSSPQTILNRLCGAVAFDPLAFTRETAQKQLEAVRQVVGLDFSEIDRARKIAFDQRTECNRDVKRIEGALKELPRYPGSVTRVDVGEVQELLQAAQTNNQRNQTARDRFAAAEAEVERRSQIVAKLRADLVDAEQDLAAGQAQLDEWRPRLAGLADTDTAELLSRMAQASTVNEQVSANERYVKAEAELGDIQEEVEALTAKIAELDAQKQYLLGNAQFPVAGLSFDEGGLLLNGLPFDQASSAERLRVSMAMALATNPALRVCLIRDGSLLDAEQLGNVAIIAAEYGAQVWIERVGAGDECSVVIEDGLVAEDRTSAGGVE